MVLERLIVDSSPLILLARIDRLDLLRILANDVTTTEAVCEELRAWRENDRTVRAVEAAAWLRVEPMTPTPPEVAEWELGPGETSVLALAGRLTGARAVLDDLDARRCAETLSIPIIGTIGLVVLAKRRGLIAAAGPLLDELVGAGIHVSKAVLEAARKRAGE